MLSKPDHKVLTALASLEGNPSFETVRSWLEDSLQHLYRDTASTKDEVLTRWMQGGVQTVERILSCAKEAKEVIRRSR